MNKYLVTIIVPLIETEYDVYIPNNKKIGTIKSYILKTLSELSNNTFNKTMSEVRLLDRDTNQEYDNNLYVKDAGIKNGTILVIM